MSEIWEVKNTSSIRKVRGIGKTVNVSSSLRCYDDSKLLSRLLSSKEIDAHYRKPLWQRSKRNFVLAFYSIKFNHRWCHLATSHPKSGILREEDQ